MLTEDSSFRVFEPGGAVLIAGVVRAERRRQSCELGSRSDIFDEKSSIDDAPERDSSHPRHLLYL